MRRTNVWNDALSALHPDRRPDVVSKENGWCFQEHNALVLGGRRTIIGFQKLRNRRLEKKALR